MANPPVAADQGAILAQLIQQTSDNLTSFSANDSWEQMRKKACTKHKIALPSLFSGTNPLLLQHPQLYIFLIAEEKTAAVGAIQTYLRTTFTEKKFLVEELCQLLYGVQLLIALLTTKNVPAQQIFEAVEPIMNVIVDKFIYISGRQAGLGVNDISTIGLTSNPSGGIQGKINLAALKKKKKNRNELHNEWRPHGV